MFNEEEYGMDGFGKEESRQPVNRKPGAAITSMVLGICSVSLWWYPFITSIPCLIMGIVAVVLARRESGRTDVRYQSFLKAGRITGIIGIIISILYTLIMGFLLGRLLTY